MESGEHSIFRTQFGGGINQTLPSRDIADDELVDALNMTVTKEVALRKRAGVQRLTATNVPSGKVTSIFHWRLSNGTQAIIATSLAKVYRSTVTTLGSVAFTDITGGLTFPSGGRWEWHQFDDKLYGFNGATTGTNPAYLSSVAVNCVATPSAWPSEPLTGCAAFRRLWWVDAAEPNRLRASALGDANSYPGTGGAADDISVLIGEDEDDGIVAVRPWRGLLIVWKRSRIYKVVPGTPNTDGTAFEVRPFSASVGLVSRFSIQQVLDDILFLSDTGVTSLAATERYDDLQQSLVSARIPSFTTMEKTDPNVFSSFVDTEAAVYGITQRQVGDAAGEATKVWTFTYGHVQVTERLPWMKHDGPLVGCSYGNLLDGTGRVRVMIGGYDGVYYWDADSVEDNEWTAAYAPGDIFAYTKSFTMDAPMRRKDFLRVTAEFRLETDPVDISALYRIDESPTRQKVLVKSFDNVLSGSEIGGTDVLDTTFKLVAGTSDTSDLTFVPRGSAGRRGQSIQFRFVSTAWDQMYTIRRLVVVFTTLGGWALVGE